MSSKVNLQNPSIPPPVNAVEIDVAIYELLLKFDSNLDWLENGYGKAYRFVEKNEKRLYVPQIYIGGNKKSYHPTVGDNDKKATCFFIVGKENNDDYEQGQFNYITWDVGLVFWVNLEKINKPLLVTEKFTQNLIRDVRHVLTMKTSGMSFGIKINNVVTDFNNVYKEFTLDETNDYHRAPYSGFRFNLSITMQETCEGFMFDPAVALCQNLSKDEKLVVLGCLDFSDPEVIGALSDEQESDLSDSICVAGDIDVYYNRPEIYNVPFTEDYEEGYLYANNYDPPFIIPSDAVYQKIDLSVSPDYLIYNNKWGHKFRLCGLTGGYFDFNDSQYKDVSGSVSTFIIEFSNPVGGVSATDGYVVDELTGIGWRTARGGASPWLSGLVSVAGSVVHGYNDWRTPTYDYFNTLQRIDLAYWALTTHRPPFLGFTQATFWTCTRRVLVPTQAIFMNTAVGINYGNQTNSYNKTFSRIHYQRNEFVTQ